MKHILMTAAAVAALSMAGAARAADTTSLYFNDFSSGATGYAGVSAAFTGGGGVENVGAGAGDLTGNVFRNATGSGPAVLNQYIAPVATLFTLSNLPSHDHITIDFDLAFFDSWDGDTATTYSPDLIELQIDSGSIYTLSADNCVANTYSSGGLGGTTSSYSKFFGGNTQDCFTDRVVDMTGAAGLTFAHTGSTLTLLIRAAGQGYQGGDDESWGYDNLSVAANLTEVQVSAAPEPAAWALMIGGFGLSGAMLRRRRTAAASA